MNTKGKTNPDSNQILSKSTDFSSLTFTIYRVGKIENLG